MDVSHLFNLPVPHPHSFENKMMQKRGHSKVPMKMITTDQVWCPRMDVLLNKWFTSYEEAKDELRNHGGFLLPFKPYFYITTEVGIAELGLNPQDPRWSLMGNDWVCPDHFESRASLIREVNGLNEPH